MYIVINIVSKYKKNLLQNFPLALTSDTTYNKKKIISRKRKTTNGFYAFTRPYGIQPSRRLE
jgi:hypothetical protein